MKTKLLVLSMVFMGIFLGFGLVSASTADVIQPAQGPTYDGLTVNGTGTFDSIKIGKQGVGGVTFFNGTIVNTTSVDGVPQAVTFGDDVRIDGGIFRTEVGPPNNLKIYDTMQPGLDAANDLGTSSLTWRSMYAKNGYFTEDAYTWGGLITAARSEGTIKAGQSEKVVIENGKPFQLLIGHTDPTEHGLASLTIMENNWFMAGVGTFMDGDNAPSVIAGECCEYTNNYMFTGANMPNLADVQCPNEKVGEHNIIIKAKSSGDIYYRVIY